MGATPWVGAFWAALFAILSTTAMAYSFSLEWKDLMIFSSNKSEASVPPVMAQKALPIKKDQPPPSEETPSLGYLQNERALLNAARSALSQMALGHATAKLREHKQRFPEGALVEEREALDVWRVAQEGDAKRTEIAVSAFLKRFKNESAHRRLVEKWQKPF